MNYIEMNYNGYEIVRVSWSSLYCFAIRKDGFEVGRAMGIIEVKWMIDNEQTYDYRAH